MRFQFVILIGIAVCYVVSTAAEAYARRGARLLPEEARRRARERIQDRVWLLYCLDAVGVAMMIFGLLRLLGFLQGFVGLIWAPRALACAVAVMCLERALRIWVIQRAFAAEPEGRPAARRGAVLAVLVTLVQTAVAVTVCAWVFTQVTVHTTRSSRTEEALPPEDQKDDVPIRLIFEQWVNQAEALKIIGRDKTYLDLLVRYDQVPTRQGADGTFYARAFLETRKESGLMPLEELQEWARKEEAKEKEGKDKE